MGQWIFRDEALPESAVAELDARRDTLEKASVKAGRRRNSYLVRIAEHTYFVKIERFKPLSVKRGLRVLFPRASRLVREARLHQAAYAAGVRVPRPLGLYYDSRRMMYVCEAQDGLSLRDVLHAPNDAQPTMPFWNDFGLQVLKLHVAGIAHGDLHAGNILVCDGRAWLTDFARATRIKNSGGEMALADFAYLAGSIPPNSSSSRVILRAFADLLASQPLEQRERHRMLGKVTALYRDVLKQRGKRRQRKAQRKRKARRT